MKSILTEREYEIAMLIATGATNKEIGRQLGISPQTVKNVLTSVYMKTDTRSRTELAVHVTRAELRESPAKRKSARPPFPRCTKIDCPFLPRPLRASRRS